MHELELVENNAYKADTISGCWNWQKAKDADGYGIIKRYGKQMHASRFFYIKHKGRVANNLVVDHLCNNRLCVNPSHLQAITQAENCRKGKTAKLDKKKVLQITDLSIAGATQSFLSAKFGVHQSQISRLLNKKTWS